MMPHYATVPYSKLAEHHRFPITLTVDSVTTLYWCCIPFWCLVLCMHMMYMTTCVHTYVHACMHVNACKCVHAYVLHCVWECVCTCVCLYVSACLYVCIHLYVQFCVCVFVCAVFSIDGVSKVCKIILLLLVIILADLQVEIEIFPKEKWGHKVLSNLLIYELHLLQPCPSCLVFVFH